MIGRGIVPVERLIVALGRDGLAEVTLRNHIRDMRKRLAEHGVYIRTVWGEGYELMTGKTS
jgi:DNA-binding response OmpR family regulator